MGKYIDAEKLKRTLIDEYSFLPAFVVRAIEEAPAADVVSKETHEAVQKALVAFAETDVVALPVKYGQVLWRIDGNGFRSPEFQKAVPVTVQEIVFKDVRGKPQWSFIASSTMFSFGGIGKTVFLTKEEAEKVIAKRRANNG